MKVMSLTFLFCLFVIIFDLAWSRKRDFRQLEHFFFYYLFVLKATQNVM